MSSCVVLIESVTHGLTVKELLKDRWQKMVPRLATSFEEACDVYSGIVCEREGVVQQVFPDLDARGVGYHLSLLGARPPYEEGLDVLEIQKRFFDLIVLGEKTIEGKVYKEGRKNLLGKVVVVKCVPDM